MHPYTRLSPNINLTDDTSQALTVVEYEYEHLRIRTVTIHGEPWFVANDATDILDIDRTQTRRLDDDEKGVCQIHTLGGMQTMTIVSEPGYTGHCTRFSVWMSISYPPYRRAVYLIIWASCKETR